MAVGERFMEFLMAVVASTENDVYATVEIRCPTSQSETLAMLVHSISFNLYLPPVIAAHRASAFAQLTKTIQTQMLDESYQDLIARAAGSVEQSGAGVVAWWEVWPYRAFSPPILIARDSLWLACDASYTERTTKAEVRIGYTLERVSKDAFIAALVS